MRWYLSGLALATAALLVACSGPSNSQQATPPGPTATASPKPDQTVFQSVVSPLVKSTPAPGDLVSADFAVVFMDAKTGAVELWSLAGSHTAYDNIWLQPSRDGKLLALHTGSAPGKWHVVRRDSGEAFEILGGWNLDISIGFENVIGAWSGLDGARLVLLDVGRQTVVPTDIDRARLAESSRVSRPDGKKVIIGDGNQFLLVDAVTGASRTVKDGLTGYRAEALPANKGFRLIPYAGESAALYFDWEGNPAPMAPGAARGLSPDGTLRAVDESPGRIQGYGMGGFPTIGVVTIESTATGLPVARFRGASFSDWSADGKTLMLGDQHAGWTVIGIDGQRWTSLPNPGLTQGGPSFSPVDPALLATNRGIINFKTGTTWLMTLKQQMSSASRWSADGAETVTWISPTPGKDGGFAEQLLPFDYQAAPFDAGIAFAVKSDGDCLNLRENPSLESTIIACLAHGSVLTPSKTLLRSLNPKEPPEDYIGKRDDSGRTWLHVATTAGIEGWVDSAYLGWAP